MAQAAFGINTAIPTNVLPTPIMMVDPEIDYSQVMIINSYTIPGAKGVAGDPTAGATSGSAGSSTPTNTQIDLVMLQQENCFLDTRTSALEVNVVVTFHSQLSTNATDGNINGYLNGAVRGSFWSFFYKYTVYANQSQPTDDITDIGVVARWMFATTMSMSMKKAVASLWGFCDDFTEGCLGARLFGAAPSLANCLRFFAGGATGMQDGKYVVMTSNTATRFSVQRFDCILPLFGTLGLGNGGMYYLGLGTTKISLWTEDPSNTFFVPGAVVNGLVNTAGGVVTMAPLCPGAATNYQSSLVIDSVVIERVQWWGNLLQVSPGVMQEIKAAGLSPDGIYRQRCTSFVVATITIPSGVSGLQMYPFNVKRWSNKLTLLVFPPTENATTVAANGTNVSPFLKYGSLNPSLGANTVMMMNNTRYPKNGYDCLNYPQQAHYENLKALQAWTGNTGARSDIQMCNWMKMDPQGILNPFPTGAWAAPTAYAQMNADLISRGWENGQFNTITATGVRSWLSTMVPTFYAGAGSVANKFLTSAVQASTDSIAVNVAGNGHRYVQSQDFYLAVDPEILPASTYVSGISVNATGNFFQANITYPLKNAYTLYYIVMFDGLMRWFFDGTGRVDFLY